MSDWVEDYLVGIIMAILLLVIGGFITSGFFWFNEGACQVSCELDFDTHGFSGTQYAIFSIVVLELIYIFFLSKFKKGKKESWFAHAAWYKFMSLFCLLGVYIIIIPIISLLIHKTTLYVIGGIGVIAIFYLVNVLIARMIDNKEEVKSRKKKK